MWGFRTGRLPDLDLCVPISPSFHNFLLICEDFPNLGLSWGMFTVFPTLSLFCPFLRPWPTERICRGIPQKGTGDNQELSPKPPGVGNLPVYLL